MPDQSLMILLAHAGSTCAMSGLIWFVQIVHYPLMSAVAPEAFTDFERRHQRLTTFVVGPLMLIEAATAVALTLGFAGPRPLALTATGLVILILIWLSTFALQVPLHDRLTRAFSARDHARLVNTNWVRTVLWSARAILALALLA